LGRVTRKGEDESKAAADLVEKEPETSCAKKRSKGAAGNVKGGAVTMFGP